MTEESNVTTESTESYFLPHRTCSQGIRRLNILAGIAYYSSVSISQSTVSSVGVREMNYKPPQRENVASLVTITIIKDLIVPWNFVKLMRGNYVAYSNL